MVATDDTRLTTDDRRRTTPRVWHKLPTGELKIISQMDLLMDSHKNISGQPNHLSNHNHP